MFSMHYLQVCVYLNSKSWETRVAASQAVEAIAKNVKKWRPAKNEEKCQDERQESPLLERSEDFMSFCTFDIKQVKIEACSVLL